MQYVNNLDQIWYFFVVGGIRFTSNTSQLFEENQYNLQL